MLHAGAMKSASCARCAEMVLMGQGKTTVSGCASERSGNLRKIVASNGEFALNLQWIRLFYGHLIRVCRPCPSVVQLPSDWLVLIGSRTRRVDFVTQSRKGKQGSGMIRAETPRAQRTQSPRLIIRKPTRKAGQESRKPLKRLGWPADLPGHRAEATVLTATVPIKGRRGAAASPSR
jgi:hypothetical protein